MTSPPDFRSEGTSPAGPPCLIPEGKWLICCEVIAKKDGEGAGPVLHNWRFPKMGDPQDSPSHHGFQYQNGLISDDNWGTTIVGNLQFIYLYYI